MLTQWAKDALIDGLHGVTGGTLTVVCPGQTHRFGQASELDATLTSGTIASFCARSPAATSALPSRSWTGTGRRRIWCRWRG